MRVMPSRNWVEWHERYDRPDSWHSARLRVVQQHIRMALDRGTGPLRVVSLCAGQGRDLLGALAGHHRALAVDAVLIELDQANVALANDAAIEAGLPNVRAVAADAGVTDSYVGVAPADLVLICGVFGNLNPHDTEMTIRRLPELCTAGATVICTHGRRPVRFGRALKRSLRTRRPPWGFSRRIRRWFHRAGFEAVAYEEFPRTNPHGSFSVASYRFGATPRPLQPGTRLFTFDGPGALWR